MQMVPDTSHSAIVSAVFVLFLVVATVCDARHRQIPNLLTGTMALLGLVVAWSGSGPATLGAGLVASSIAFALGMILQALRVMGGGDVKLFAAAALWLGPGLTMTAALATAIAGGVAAIFFFRTAELRSVVAARMSLSRLQLDDGPDDDRVPYGIAIAVGCVWAWWSQFHPGMGIL